MADTTDREKIEKKVTDLGADKAAAEQEVQQLVGREQLRTSPDPSHEKIREDKELPTPDPDKLPPEDGGHQTNPKEVVTNEAEFKKKAPEDKNAQKEAAEEAKGVNQPDLPNTLGDSGGADKSTSKNKS